MNEIQKSRVKRAAQDLERILDEIGPFIRRPTVVEPSTRDKWVKSDSFSFEAAKEKPEASVA